MNPTPKQYALAILAAIAANVLLILTATLNH